MNILNILTKKRIIGNVGEDAVRRYLRRKHYKILARNYVAEGHEIDIIAEDKMHLCFVEVKTRTLGRENPNEPRPSSAVTPKKQQGIILAAADFLSMRKNTKRIRFDVAEVLVNERTEVQSINYIENAFTRDTAYYSKGIRRK